jgi:hypothetical protein
MEQHDKGTLPTTPLVKSHHRFSNTTRHLELEFFSAVVTGSVDGLEPLGSPDQLHKKLRLDPSLDFKHATPIFRSPSGT